MFVCKEVNSSVLQPRFILSCFLLSVSVVFCACGELSVIVPWLHLQDEPNGLSSILEAWLFWVLLKMSLFFGFPVRYLILFI